MLRSVFISALLSLASFALASPANAQMSHGSDYKGQHHGTHDHSAHEPADHIMPESPKLRMSDQPKLHAAIAAGGEPIVAKVLGVVCEFCSTAMNKTFGKRDDVAAVYVDLDESTLNLVLKPGETITDKALRKAVKKSGYKVDKIEREPDLTHS